MRKIKTAKRFCSLTERDYEVFKNLWKWKMLSTSALHVMLFKNCSPDVCYNRLRKLERRGYITSIYLDTLKGFIWTLNTRGYKSCRPLLPDLVQNGYKSEHKEHDFWVTVVHQSGFLSKTPDNYRTISEQQLRRIDPDHLKEWIPSPDLHRPDGYWYYTNGVDKKSITSLEVEFSQKNRSAFSNTISFYEHCTQINNVVWVVKNTSFGKRIVSKVKDGIQSENQIHFVFKLDHIVDQGWNAKSFASTGESKTINQILFEDSLEEVIKLSSASMVESMTDFRRIPNKNNNLNKS